MKNIFMIWIGNKIPKYAQFSFQNYRKMNPSFDVQLVHVTQDMLYNIYNGIKFEHKFYRELVDSAKCIFEQISPYTQLIDKQIQIYGKNIRFIQIFSDVLRMQLVNNYGGIYVDCDTFPIKPFRSLLDEHNRFIVSHPYNVGFDKHAMHTIDIDNYFFGCINNKIYNLRGDNIYRLFDEISNDCNSIDYIYRKQLFYKCELSITTFNKDNRYIEHYYNNSWVQSKNKVLCVPYCIFDKKLVQYIHGR